MKKYVSLDKRSKKAQREYHAKQRRTWGELNPVTRSVPSGKTYNRKKEKQRIGKEFRNGFDADSFNYIILKNLSGIRFILLPAVKGKELHFASKGEKEGFSTAYVVSSPALCACMTRIITIKLGLHDMWA